MILEWEPGRMWLTPFPLLAALESCVHRPPSEQEFLSDLMLVGSEAAWSGGSALETNLSPQRDHLSLRWVLLFIEVICGQMSTWFLSITFQQIQNVYFFFFSWHSSGRLMVKITKNVVMSLDLESNNAVVRFFSTTSGSVHLESGHMSLNLLVYDMEI